MREQREIWIRLADIYDLLLKLDQVLDRAIFVPAAGREVADLRGPARFSIKQTGDQFWLQHLAELQDPVEGYLLRGAPVPGARVFDAGAFCGQFAIVAARRVGPGGTVIAFEPDARNREYLERNIREAGLTNVTIWPGGLWSETGEVEFAATGTRSARVAALENAAPASDRVPVLSLRDAAARFGAPDFVKMDIEGGEVEVVAGAADWLREQRVRFAIASYHMRAGRATSTYLEPMFRALGYQAATGHPEHLTTWAWKD